MIEWNEEPRTVPEKLVTIGEIVVYVVTISILLGLIWSAS